MCSREVAVLVLLLAALRLNEWFAGADVACLFEFVTSLCRGKLIYCYSLSFVRLFFSPYKRNERCSIEIKSPYFFERVSNLIDPL